MVKKAKATADTSQQTSGAGLIDNALSTAVRESAEKIWLAGMGAFAKAQSEGKQVFESLVRDGTALQKKTQSVAEDKIDEVSARMSSMAEGVQAKAGQHWDKLESIFEERTARALRRLGIPTARDLHTLSARIDALSAKLEPRASKSVTRADSTKAGANQGPARKAAAKKTTARKATAPRAAPKGTAKKS